MLSCIVGFTMLLGSIYMSLDDKKDVYFIKFYESLDESQKQRYESIVRERLMIYMIGMLLGLYLGGMYYFKYNKDAYRLCKTLSIIYIVKLGFYYVYPKQPLMLYSLTNDVQVKAWADIYTHMKQRWIYSLLVGFIGYIVLGMSVSCN